MQLVLKVIQELEGDCITYHETERTSLYHNCMLLCRKNGQVCMVLLHNQTIYSWCKVRKRTKIRNRCHQALPLAKDTNGKVTNTQLDITNKSREVSPFPAGQ